MTSVGYARVSSTGQDLALQLEKLAGCDRVKPEHNGILFPLTPWPQKGDYS
jgi:hypothetical protein